MSEPEWTLWYHPLAGRGEFVRIIFEEAGVPFKEINDREMIMNKLKQLQDGGWPVLAVPMITKGDFALGQTGTICKYLGKQFNLYPKSTELEILSDQLCSTITDFIAEGRLAFHGQDYYATYYNQIEFTQPYIQRFVRDRLPKFLQHFESVLSWNKGNGHCTSDPLYAVGPHVTYCDLNLLHVLRAAESQFPDAWSQLQQAYPLLMQFKQQMENRPKLKVYFASDRCRPFEGNSMM